MMIAPRASLNALRAFEATARLRSMSAAGEELNVTHGAVSRQIRALEALFGITLLDRALHLEPTSQGAALADTLTTAFNLIDASLAQLKPGPLTLSCSASIMMYFLIPKIGRFHKEHPQVDVQFNMNYDQMDFVRDKISVAIRNSIIEPPKDAIVRDLMQEWIGPVCSPGYLRQHQIRLPEDLTRAHLLASNTRPDAWRDWTKTQPSCDLHLAANQLFDHFYLLIQAATCGLGIAPVPQMLVVDDLRTGKLVAPFGFAPGPRRIVLWTAPHLCGRPDAIALSDWLATEMQNVAATQKMAPALSADAFEHLVDKVDG
jgi:DNA-binding transcriptional LysR family regulator